MLGLKHGGDFEEDRIWENGCKVHHQCKQKPLRVMITDTESKSYFAYTLQLHRQKRARIKEIFRLCRFGTAKELMKCKDKEVFHSRDKNFQDALMLSASNSDSSCCSYLLQRTRADMWHKRRNFNGQSALHFAVRSGNIDNVRIVASFCPIFLNCGDIGGQTPLHEAVIAKRSDMVQVLLEHKACFTLENNLRETALEISVELNSCLECFVQINLDDVVKTVCKRGSTELFAEFLPRARFSLQELLHVAIEGKNSSVCMEILPLLDDCDILCSMRKDDATLLTAAILRDMPLFVLDEMLKMGAADDPNGYGITPVCAAAIVNNSSLINHLAGKQFSIEAPCEKATSTCETTFKTPCETALFHAVENCSEESVDILLKLGANVKKVGLEELVWSLHILRSTRTKLLAAGLRNIRSCVCNWPSHGTEGTLQHLCREQIRKSCCRKVGNLFATVAQLPLPKILRTYVMYDLSVE